MEIKFTKLTPELSAEWRAKEMRRRVFYREAPDYFTEAEKLRRVDVKIKESESWNRCKEIREYQKLNNKSKKNDV